MPDTVGREQTIQRVAVLAAEVVAADLADVTAETHFEADLNYDSLEKVEFVMKVEEAFEIDIPDEAAVEVRTVGEAVDLVLGYVGQ